MSSPFSPYSFVLILLSSACLQALKTRRTGRNRTDVPLQRNAFLLTNKAFKPNTIGHCGTTLAIISLHVHDVLQGALLHDEVLDCLNA